MAFVLLIFFLIAVVFILIGVSLSSRTSSSGKQKGVPPVQTYRVSSAQVNRRVRVHPLQKVEHRRIKASSVQHPLKSVAPWRLIDHQTSSLGIILILLSFLAFGAYSLNALVPHSALFVGAFADKPDISASPTQITPAQPQLFSGMVRASKALTRVSQLDIHQYSSSQEYDMWAYSACSAAALTEVFNAYGRHYRVTDVLSLEASIGEITPELGLVESVGIDRTATRFGFKATWLNKPSLDDMLAIANTGRPVIIGFPPERWSGGHILITLGGDKNTVYLADTSRLNMKSMPRATFLKYWVGFAVVVTPN